MTHAVNPKRIALRAYEFATCSSALLMADMQILDTEDTQSAEVARR